MSRFQSIFLRGLIVTLPVTLTVVFLVWVITKFEQLLAPLWQNVLGTEHYITGLGLVSSLTLVMLIGIMVDNYLTQRIVQSIVNHFSKFPVIKSIYGPIRDFFTLLGGQGGATAMKNVVLYEAKPNTWMIGLVTRENFNDPKLKVFEDMGLVPVYLPSSFMFGGYTVLINKNQLKYIDLPVNQAMKMAITGWIHIENDKT